MHAFLSGSSAQRFADKLRAPKATVGFIGLLGCCAGAPGAQLGRAEAMHPGGSWTFGHMSAAPCPTEAASFTIGHGSSHSRFVSTI